MGIERWLDSMYDASLPAFVVMRRETEAGRVVVHLWDVNFNLERENRLLRQILEDARRCFGHLTEVLQTPEEMRGEG